MEASRGDFSSMLPKRAEPHDRVQGATDLQGSRGVNRRSREERQGRNVSEGGIFRPKGGQPPGSGRARIISMEGHLWKTPGEEFEQAFLVRQRVGFIPMHRLRKAASFEQRATDRDSFFLSLKET